MRSDCTKKGGILTKNIGTEEDFKDGIEPRKKDASK
jgi:hypothetical protein